MAVPQISIVVLSGSNFKSRHNGILFMVLGKTKAYNQDNPLHSTFWVLTVQYSLNALILLLIVYMYVFVDNIKHCSLGSHKMKGSTYNAVLIPYIADNAQYIPCTPY